MLGIIEEATQPHGMSQDNVNTPGRVGEGGYGTIPSMDVPAKLTNTKPCG